MRGDLIYTNGGAGIWSHVDGPFAGLGFSGSDETAPSRTMAALTGELLAERGLPFEASTEKLGELAVTEKALSPTTRKVFKYVAFGIVAATGVLVALKLARR